MTHDISYDLPLGIFLHPRWKEISEIVKCSSLSNYGKKFWHNKWTIPIVSRINSTIISRAAQQYSPATSMNFNARNVVYIDKGHLPSMAFFSLFVLLTIKKFMNQQIYNIIRIDSVMLRFFMLLSSLCLEDNRENIAASAHHPGFSLWHPSYRAH